VIPVVGAVGAGVLLAGVAVFWLACNDWRLAHETADQPQEITLTDLLKNGYGSNRHVHITGYRFCDKKVEDSQRKDSKLTMVSMWAPVVPADNGNEQAAPAVPRKVLVVLRESELRNAEPPELKRLGMGRSKWQNREKKGYTGVVVTGLRNLPDSTSAALREMAPETDFGSLLIVTEDVKPISVAAVQRSLVIGGIGIGLGLVVLGLTYFWGRSVQRSSPVASF
jgi:hypothetical protein